MFSSDLPEPDLLKTVLLPLLEDFQYWFGRSRSLLESEEITFLSQDQQADLLARVCQAQQEVMAAQEEHAAAEARWGLVRDSLRAISQTTERMSAQGLRGTPQYLQAFESFDRLEAEEARVKREMDAAFERFTQLQEATIFQMDSIRVARETWADEAFADFGQVVAAHLERTGREEMADTTNAAGVATFRAPAGQWWVHARYTLPFEELYWNVPLQVEGDTVYIRLSEENAEVRPAF